MEHAVIPRSLLPFGRRVDQDGVDGCGGFCARSFTLKDSKRLPRYSQWMSDLSVSAVSHCAAANTDSICPAFGGGYKRRLQDVLASKARDNLHIGRGAQECQNTYQAAIRLPPHAFVHNRSVFSSERDCQNTALTGQVFLQRGFVPLKNSGADYIAIYFAEEIFRESV